MRSFLRVLVGIREVVLRNSGSANLLALSALTSSKLGDCALRPGDEVTALAAGFPTTLNWIVQNVFIPVFIDVELGNRRRQHGTARRSHRAQNACHHDGAHAG